MRCPSCGSENVVKRGRRKNKYTTKQMYWCKDCKKKFIQKDGFQNMTYPPELITKVLHLRAECMSLAGIRDYIYQLEGYYLYDSAILHQTKKYAKRLSQPAEQFLSRHKWRRFLAQRVEKAGGHEDKCPDAVGKATSWTIEILLEKKQTTEAKTGNYYTTEVHDDCTINW